MKPPGYGPQVVVEVSIYRGNPFWVHIFDPQACGCEIQLPSDTKVETIRFVGIYVGESTQKPALKGGANVPSEPQNLYRRLRRSQCH